MMPLRHIIVGIFVGSLFSCLNAQTQFRYTDDAEKTFSNAVHLMNNGQDGGALRLFQRLIEMQPVHQRTTAAYIMAGKTLQRMGRYTESIRLLKYFSSHFQSSAYRQDANYTLALDYLMLQQPLEALIHLAIVSETPSNDPEYGDALGVIMRIPFSQFPDSVLRIIREKTTNPELRDLVSIKIAENNLHNGRKQEAESYLDEIILRVPKSRYEKDALVLKGKLSSVINVRIGVVLPLMKNSQDSQIGSIAEEMLDGIEYAVRQVRRGSTWNGSISLDVRDSERNPKIARKEIQHLANDNNVIGIIGPLFSEEAQLVAPVAAEEGIPLLTPTATANGIAAAGSTVFQLNPDYENRGRAMARFAVKDLGYKTLGVLASSEPIGKALAEYFTNEARRLGATVVACEYYTKGASDLSDQFYALRTAGSRQDGKRISPRNLDIPIKGIEGLYVAISEVEEIGIVASQMKYFNLATTLLGNDEWYNLSQLDLNKRYLGQLYVVSDNDIDDRTSDVGTFTRMYNSEMKKTPTRYSMIGYDAMSLLATALQHGGGTRGKLTEYLSGIRGYRGIHSKITLTNHRVNSELSVFQYLEGRFQFVKGISAH